MNQQTNLRETLSKVIKKGWIILLLIVVFGLGARIFSANFIAKVYKAQTTLFIGTEQSAQTNITLSDLEASNQLIVDYKEIAHSRMVIEPVMRKFGLTIDMKEFVKALSLETLGESRLFSLGFSSKDPELAAQVANEMALQLTAAVADIVKVENIRIIDTALVPTEQDFPELNIITLLAAILGLALGLLFIYFNDLYNDTYSTQESIENELQLDVFAFVPKRKKNNSSDNKGLITRYESNSLMAECFKMLRTNIDYMNKDGDNKVLMLTSAVGAEDKTLASCNLAITYAQEHKRVLLIDGDLRRQNLFKAFRINMMPGVTDIIYGNYALSEAVQSVIDVPRLDILAAGRSTSMTSEVLTSDTFAKMIEEARGTYDYVIIDAPPVLNVSDTVIISNLADKVLFVVGMDETKRALVKEAKRHLDMIGAKLMGMILTNMTIDPRSYYYGLGDVKRMFYW